MKVRELVKSAGLCWFLHLVQGTMFLFPSCYAGDFAHKLSHPSSSLPKEYITHKRALNDHRQRNNCGSQSTVYQIQLS
uniref:Uncharacterized protein n=1 Tax=Noccaea caerulescens TaxID=107243 RepID=A0A1J3CZ27_NOCCA